MTPHPDQKLIGLGQQFNVAVRQARKWEKKKFRLFDTFERLASNLGVAEDDNKARLGLRRECGYDLVYDIFTTHHSKAVRIMRAIYRERATTLEGFAVKLAAVTFDQFDFNVSPTENEGDVAERQLLRLSRQMTAAVSNPSADLSKLIAKFVEAKAARDVAWDAPDYSGGPEQDAVDAVERAIILHPCRDLNEVRAKAAFFLENEGPYDTIRNCRNETEETLLLFLRSLLGVGSDE